MRITSSEFIHPEDAEALRQLEAITGFPILVKKFLSLGFERYQYGQNLASSIRLSPTQLPKLYAMLPPICERLGIPVPEFYLKMDPQPNAWTFGDTRIYITITSALIDLLDDEELTAVIAHECGHIVCRHVLYHTIAQWVMLGMDGAGLLGVMALPLRLAILYWERRSELSCDRAASVITSPEVVSRTMARLAGGPLSLTRNVDFGEWAKQADEYDALCHDSAWDKVLQSMAVMSQNHPFAAVRVREVLKWGQSEQYRRIRSGIVRATSGGGVCPRCQTSTEPSWAFCRNCGAKLKSKGK